MPHCLIEFSDSLQNQCAPAELVACVQQAVVATELFDASHVRSRAKAFEDFTVGYGMADFIHVSIRMHVGRSDEQKRALTACVLEALKSLKLAGISLSVETIDMETASYAKASTPR